MPRDASGNFTLVAGNPVVSGTIIESDWANNTMADIANEMTDSLSRSAEGGMLAPLGLALGSNTVTSLYFGTSVNTGLYSTNSTTFAAAANGTFMQLWTENGTEVWDAYFGTLVPLGLTFENDQIDLSEATGAIFLGSHEPNTEAHIAIDQRSVQAKSNGTTSTTLRLNPFGGSVIIGPSLTGANSGNVIVGGFTETGGVDLYNDTSLSARTVSSGAGGLEVANFVTGSGLERVLTLSDLSTPQFDVVIDGADPTLANANAALTTGSDNPSAEPHIAYGPTSIQAKANGTTVDDLKIGPLGGEVNLGSISAASTIRFSSNGQTLMQTLSPASGSMWINNTDTGAGLERVATSSDVTAPVTATFVASRYEYLVDTFARPSFNYTTAAVPASTVVTIGPTGSGANHIWTALDDIPLQATKIKLRIALDVAASTGATGTNLAQVSTAVAPTAAGSLVGVTYTVGTAQTYNRTTGGTGSDSMVNDFEVLLDGANTFKTRFTVQNFFSYGIQLVLQGYSR